MRRFLVINSISLVNTGQLTLPVSSCMKFDRLSHLRNLSISPILEFIGKNLFLILFYYTFEICSLHSDSTSLIPNVDNLYPHSLSLSVSLFSWVACKRFHNLSDVLKDLVLGYINFLYCFLFSILLISTQIFIISVFTAYFEFHILFLL